MSHLYQMIVNEFSWTDQITEVSGQTATLKSGEKQTNTANRSKEQPA